MNEKKVQFSDIVPLIEEKLNQGQTVTFSPSGVSMLPMLKAGRDTVHLIAAQGEIKKYDVVFFKREDGSFVLHRVIKVGETYDIVGDNQLYAEIGIKKEQIIGVVASYERNGKTFSAKGVGNYIYGIFAGCKRFFKKAANKISRILTGRT